MGKNAEAPCYIQVHSAATCNLLCDNGAAINY